MSPETRTQHTLRAVRSYILWFLPLGFWVALWLSLQAGDIGGIFRSGNLFDRLHALRAVIPLAAIFASVAFILFQQRRQRQTISLLGPLGLTAIYGAVGLLASLNSPAALTAVYWSLAYLSVPVVLWAVVWNPRPLSRAAEVVNLNWLVIIGGVCALFVFGLVKMDLGTLIADPSLLLQCQSGRAWVAETSGVLRSTGVGRYAAISAIVALSLFWRGQRRWLWGPVLAGSVILLLSSGARTSLAGFAVGATLVALASGSKKTLIWGAAALAVLAVLAATTGVYGDFIDGCIKKYSDPPQTQALASPDADAVAHETLEATSTPAVAETSAPTSAPVVPETPAPTSAPAVPETPAPTSAPVVAETPAPMSAPVVAETPDSESDPRDSNKIPTLTGRTQVWRQGWNLFTKSPVLGYGFHADRIILNAHMHNAFMHALVQTGILGTLPFIAAILYGWVMLVKAFLSRENLTAFHKHLLIQTGGVLAFLSVRAIPESTGAFFGVDWIILGPLLLYLQVVNDARATGEQPV